MNSKDIRVLLSKVIARAGILSFGDYMLSCGKRTQYYLDFSMLANMPAYLRKVLEIIREYIRDRGLDRDVSRIVGVLNKGILFVPNLSILLKKPFTLFSRYDDEPVLGVLDVNDSVMVFDDMVSSGRTLERILKIVEENYKSTVKNIVVLVDREEGGFERIRSMGYDIHAILRVSTLADILYDLGKLSEEERDVIYSEIRG